MLKKILEFNRVILTLVVIEFFMNGAFSTIGPFFAIFITQDIAGGSAKVAGFAAAIYWAVKSLVQLPISRWLDKTDGEMDDFWALFAGYILSTGVPIIYFFATLPWHIYLAQGILGFFFAWATPAWYSIFTRHLDKFRIGFEWSLYSVLSVGVSTTIAAALAGLAVDAYGFRIIFLLASVIIFLSGLSLLYIRPHLIKARGGLEKVIPEKTRKI